MDLCIVQCISKSLEWIFISVAQHVTRIQYLFVLEPRRGVFGSCLQNNESVGIYVKCCGLVERSYAVEDRILRCGRLASNDDGMI
jgi:hypothetical protein